MTMAGSGSENGNDREGDGDVSHDELNWWWQWRMMMMMMNVLWPVIQMTMIMLACNPPSQACLKYYPAAPLALDMVDVVIPDKSKVRGLRAASAPAGQQTY